ncbi:MAG: HD domain-containing protein [Bacilli bacterium]|nr:HD domain-containing protein [Bacilli bacterium]
MKINKELKKYIEDNIFPSYKKNDEGHNLDHIEYVIERSFKFANNISTINLDMVYVIASYHDIGYYIDAKNHEKISSEMLLADDNLKKFFTEEEIITMAEAVYDHRASMDGEPRSIYGKIVSSADRETRVDVQLQRMYKYRLTHYPDKSLDWIIEDTRLYIINKFGKKGYATEKIYFEDLDYKKFLKELSKITENKDEFKIRFIKANNLE